MSNENGESQSNDNLKDETSNENEHEKQSNDLERQHSTDLIVLPGFELSIKLLNENGQSEEHKIRVDSDKILVEELRGLVAVKAGVNLDRIRMIFRGQALDDGKRLSDYRIAENSILHAIVRRLERQPIANQSNGAPPTDTNNTETSQTRASDGSDAFSSLFSAFLSNAATSGRGGVIEFEMSGEGNDQVRMRSTAIPPNQTRASGNSMEIGIGLSPSTSCPHDLTYGPVATPGSTGNWWCNNCYRRFAGNAHHCAQCDFHLCQRCYEQRGNSNQQPGRTRSNSAAEPQPQRSISFGNTRRVQEQQPHILNSRGFFDTEGFFSVPEVERLREASRRRQTEFLPLIPPFDLAARLPEAGLPFEIRKRPSNGLFSLSSLQLSRTQYMRPTLLMMLKLPVPSFRNSIFGIITLSDQRHPDAILFRRELSMLSDFIQDVQSIPLFASLNPILDNRYSVELARFSRLLSRSQDITLDLAHSFPEIFSPNPFNGRCPPIVGAFLRDFYEQLAVNALLVADLFDNVPRGRDDSFQQAFRDLLVDRTNQGDEADDQGGDSRSRQPRGAQ